MSWPGSSAHGQQPNPNHVAAPPHSPNPPHLFPELLRGVCDVGKYLQRLRLSSWPGEKRNPKPQGREAKQRTNSSHLNWSPHMEDSEGICRFQHPSYSFYSTRHALRARLAPASDTQGRARARPKPKSKRNMVVLPFLYGGQCSQLLARGCPFRAPGPQLAQETFKPGLARIAKKQPTQTQNKTATRACTRTITQTKKERKKERKNKKKERNKKKETNKHFTNTQASLPASQPASQPANKQTNRSKTRRLLNP